MSNQNKCKRRPFTLKTWVKEEMIRYLFKDLFNKLDRKVDKICSLEGVDCFSFAGKNYTHSIDRRYQYSYYLPIKDEKLRKEFNKFITDNKESFKLVKKTEMTVNQILSGAKNDKILLWLLPDNVYYGTVFLADLKKTIIINDGKKKKKKEIKIEREPLDYPEQNIVDNFKKNNEALYDRLEAAQVLLALSGN